MMLYSTKSSAPAEGRRHLAEYYDVISTEEPLLFGAL